MGLGSMMKSVIIPCGQNQNMNRNRAYERSCIYSLLFMTDLRTVIFIVGKERKKNKNNWCRTLYNLLKKKNWICLHLQS